MTRAFFDPAMAYVACLALVAALLAVATVPRAFRLEPLGLGRTVELLGGNLVCALVAFLATGQGRTVVVWTAVALLVTRAIELALPQLTVAGVLEMALSPLALLVSVPWSWLLVRENGGHGWVLVLGSVGAVIALLLLWPAFACKLAKEAMLTRAVWRQPRRPAPLRVAGDRPTVSLHVPAYAEPPAVVMAVLDRLARLDYDDYEVLVCDNNTEDEQLWRPVERHCAELNRTSGVERFRFFHVAPLSGAKAGALNFLLERTAPDIDLIGVVDADYLARPDFLARLVGFFDDPGIGFVQTSHDYRRWQHSTYQRACYWQYVPAYKVEMPGVNEYRAAWTVGTMCLFRAEGLRAVGGWAEWCLTEDSEVSVRLRTLGLQGVFVRDTFGRGLIPETFDDLKKQRFRWTAGPSQQLRRHWRLFRPRRFGGSERMGAWTKLLELQHSAGALLSIVQVAVTPIALQALMIATVLGAMRPLSLPHVLWLSVVVTGVAQLVTTWHHYRLAGCRTVLDMVRGELGRLSLTYIGMYGGVAGLSRRAMHWRRTPKFGARSRGLAALRGTLPEIVLALVFLGLAVEAVVLERVIGRDLVLVTLVGSVVPILSFLSAPVMALLGERSVARRPPAGPIAVPTAEGR